MNTVNLLGRITANPELKHTPSNTAVCSFTVAVDRPFKDQSGNKQTDFINCVSWRQAAEFISRYFSKGQMLGLTGSIQTRKYQDKDGNNRYAVEVLVERAFFGGNANSQPTLSFAEAAEEVEVEEEDGGDLPF